MATFSGTGSNDVITPASVSAGVTSTPAGSRPGEDADSLYGQAGDDTLDGGGGADYLSGGANNDTLRGGTENDSLYGDAGADDLTGGEGDDYLAGGADNDVYRFASGSGRDTLYEAVNGGTDTLVLAGGFTSADVKIYAENDDLRIVFGSDQILIQDQFANGVGSSAAVELLRYGGAKINLTSVQSDWLTRTGTSRGDSLTGSIFADTLSGAGGRDTLQGGLGDDRLNGDAGEDTLYGGAGVDILDGGTENDVLYGGADGDRLTGGGADDYLAGELGDDVYTFGPDFGVDQVAEGFNAGLDTILFNAGVNKADVKIWVDGDDLILTNGDDVIRVVDQFASGVGSSARVEKLQHSDGTRLNINSVQSAWLLREGGSGSDSFSGSIFNDTLNGGGGGDTLSGAAGKDTIDGGAGSDTLYGGAGNDVLSGGDENDNLYGDAGADLLTGGTGDDYLAGGVDNDNYAFAAGFGVDTVFEQASAGTDAIRLAAGIAPADVKIRAVDDDLIVTIGDDTIVIQDQYATGLGSAARVERLVFDDGSPTITLTSVNAAWLTSNGTSSNDTLNGSIFDDTLNGLGGADSIAGGRGNDALNGGTGADTLFGGDGADVLNGGAGSDQLYGQAGSDVFRFDLAPGPVGVDYVADFTSGADKFSLENGVFAGIAENAVMAASSFKVGAAATDSNDRIIFDPNSRALYYDPDGTGAAAQIQFATLAGSATLSNTDFIIT